MVHTKDLIGKNFKEGDEYWTVENVNGEITLLNSVWDDQSVNYSFDDLKPHKFRHLAYVILYLKQAGLHYVRFVDFRYPKPMNIRLFSNPFN